MGLLLNGQLIAGRVEIAIIRTALAHVVARIRSGHFSNYQTVAHLLQVRERGKGRERD